MAVAPRPVSVTVSVDAVAGEVDELFHTYFTYGARAGLLACDIQGVSSSDLLFRSRASWASAVQRAAHRRPVARDFDMDTFVQLRFNLNERQRQTRFRELFAERERLALTNSVEDRWRQREALLMSEAGEGANLESLPLPVTPVDDEEGAPFPPGFVIEATDDPDIEMDRHGGGRRPSAGSHLRVVPHHESPRAAASPGNATGGSGRPTPKHPAPPPPAPKPVEGPPRFPKLPAAAGIARRVEPALLMREEEYLMGALEALSQYARRFVVHERRVKQYHHAHPEFLEQLAASATSGGKASSGHGPSQPPAAAAAHHHNHHHQLPALPTPTAAAGQSHQQQQRVGGAAGSSTATLRRMRPPLTSRCAPWRVPVPPSDGGRPPTTNGGKPTTTTLNSSSSTTAAVPSAEKELAALVRVTMATISQNALADRQTQLIESARSEADPVETARKQAQLRRYASSPATFSVGGAASQGVLVPVGAAASSSSNSPSPRPAAAAAANPIVVRRPSTDGLPSDEVSAIRRTRDREFVEARAQQVEQLEQGRAARAADVRRRVTTKYTLESQAKTVRREQCLRQRDNIRRAEEAYVLAAIEEREQKRSRAAKLHEQRREEAAANRQRHVHLAALRHRFAGAIEQMAVRSEWSVPEELRGLLQGGVGGVDGSGPFAEDDRHHYEQQGGQQQQHPGVITSDDENGDDAVLLVEPARASRPAMHHPSSSSSYPAATGRHRAGGRDDSPVVTARSHHHQAPPSLVPYKNLLAGSAAGGGGGYP